MRARVKAAKMTDELMAISEEIDALESVFKQEKKACFEDVFLEHNLNEDENDENKGQKKKIIENIQNNIENNMNYLIKKQIILNQVYMAKSKSRFSELSQVIIMQAEAIEDLTALRKSIEDELKKIRKNKKKMQEYKIR